jgi:hypothetical protein
MEEGSVASSLFWRAKKAEWSIFAIKLRKVVAFFDLVVDNGIRDMFYSIIIILLKNATTFLLIREEEKREEKLFYSIIIIPYLLHGFK